MPSARRLCISARAALSTLFCAYVPLADAAFVSATASGTIWGTPAGDQELGTGIEPVSASAAYERPPQANDGRYSAFSSAAVGLLATGAELSVTNAPGYLSANHSTQGTSLAEGFSSFQDRWIFGDRPLDTPGRLRLVLAFDGAASGSATGATADVFGKLDLNLTSLADLDQPYASESYHSGPLPVADETVPLELDFLYGRPVVVGGTLLARVQLFSELTVYAYSGSGDSSFDHTASLVELEVQNHQGQWTTSYELQTESGGQYPFQAPEPSNALAPAAALLALAAARRRRLSSRAQSVTRRHRPENLAQSCG